ncbi:hypothetical protein [Actinacidiphila oryziradicis]|jgi:hypothetical protein|uniref:Uncharacterized protein n=2 Tax=Actinacidiphila oryziradicis TaxID=2571141 RepID=A0A4U0SKB1_9ACTN|nr:hypothetical protein [Actinacidiphila oryziradicis]TKA10046.1 hypothetical protein FCI23_19140 [Actinacidiphila oryziradicis]
MLDCATLLRAVDRLAGRFRALPQSRLRGAVAEAGLALARELAAEAQRIEFPGREVRIIPDEGVFVVGDQIAVAGHELAAALEPYPAYEERLDAAVRRVEAVAKACGL